MSDTVLIDVTVGIKQAKVLSMSTFNEVSTILPLLLCFLQIDLLL